MVPGFNHNVLYKGVVFHVQTEDSGVKKPLITTLLYREGTIIASRKTDYSDIIMADMLDKVVEDLMKEQHKDMLRRLKSGEFDSRAFTADTSRVSEQPAEEPAHSPPPPQPVPSGEQENESPRQTKTLDELILDYLASSKE